MSVGSDVEREAALRDPAWKIAVAFLAMALAIGAGVVLLRPGKKAPHGTEGVLHAANADGRTGAYYLPPPSDPPRPLPLLVALHGTGGAGVEMVRAFRDLADEYRFAIVAPDSGRAPTGQWSWAVGDHRGDVTADYRHVIDCVDEARALPGITLDPSRLLIAGHSAGGSAAPYIASNADLFTAFAVMHGGVFPGGLGGHVVRGWFSTGRADNIRPPDGVRAASEQARAAGFADVELHLFDGGHGLSAAEMRGLVEWWLGAHP